MFGMYFLKEAGAVIDSYESAKVYADTAKFGRYFHAMLNHGIYMAPSQFEAGFVSSAHGEEEIRLTVEAARAVMAGI